MHSANVSKLIDLIVLFCIYNEFWQNKLLFFKKKKSHFVLVEKATNVAGNALETVVVVRLTVFTARASFYICK